MYISGELTETGYSLRKNNLWLTYQNYLKSNQSRIVSLLPEHRPVKLRKQPGVGIEGSRQKIDAKHEGYREPKSRIERAKEEQIVVPGQPPQDKNVAMELEGQGQKLLDQNEAGKPKHDGYREPQSRKERPKDERIVVPGHPVQDRNVAKETDGEGQRLIDQNEAGEGMAAGRKLLNFRSINKIEFEMDEDIVAAKLVKPELDIQPEDGKLLPWERDGDFDEVQKVIMSTQYKYESLHSWYSCFMIIFGPTDPNL